MAKTPVCPWIDISVPLYNGMAHWPGDPVFRGSRAKSIEQGDVCNLTEVSTCVHTGTHMDAPRHFIKDGVGMEKMPLEAVIGRCRVVEIKDREAIKPGELKPLRLREGERVLFKTRNSTRAWKKKEFVKDFVYVSKEAAQFLVDRGVQTIGVDYLSVGGFYKDGPETHRILLGAEVWIIEGLNLAKIVPGQYELFCLPIKIVGSDGAPARAVLRPC
jgi:arylformamidase